MSKEGNIALTVLKNIFFCYLEGDAEIRLHEMTNGKATPLDLQHLRDYCIDGLHEYVEGKIEKYIDDLALAKQEEAV